MSYLQQKPPFRHMLITLAALIVSSCTSGQAPTPIPAAVYPDSSSPVQVNVLSREQFSISNHTALPIYYQVFPTELLPLIDWAPCHTDESCQNIQIPPSESLTFQFENVAERDSESITVFWWQRASDPGQHNPEYQIPQSISFPVP